MTARPSLIFIFFSPILPLLLCWMFVSGRVSPLVEFHTNHSVTSVHGRPWRTAEARAFEMSNLFLRWEGRWSLKRLFIMQSAECGGCPQLSTSLYCWRRPQWEERRKAEGVWTARWYPEPLFTLDDNTLKEDGGKLSLLINLYLFLT